MDPNKQRSHRTNRACLSCQKRKVKCNGNLERCQQCSHLNLRCIYASVTQKCHNRPKAIRGSVIRHIRDNGPPAVAKSTSLIASPPTPPIVSSDNYSSVQTASLPCFSLNGETPAFNFTRDFFQKLIPQYERYVYCINPIITPSEILESIDRMDHNHIDSFLVHSFGAGTLSVTSPDWKSNKREVQRIKQLISQAYDIRSRISTSFLAERGERLRTILDARYVMSFMFLEIALVSLDLTEEALLMLREAVTLVQLLRIDNSNRLPAIERARRIRLHWQVYIHERFCAIIAGYCPILPALPLDWLILEEEDNLPPHIKEGFQYLVQIFSIIDADFITYWTATGQSSVTVAWVERKRLQLDVPADNETIVRSSTLNATQRADLIVTRHWCLTLLWQIAISNCLLSSHSQSQSQTSAMSLEYPVRLSQQLRHMVTQLGRQTIERHGSGIIQKLFEITNTIADVIIHVPAATREEDVQRRDDFHVLLTFLYDFASLDEIQSRILAEKTARVREESGPT